MATVVFKRPVIVDGAFYGKGDMAEFAELDWFLAGLVEAGEAEVVEDPDAEPAEPQAPAEKKVAAGARKRK